MTWHAESGGKSGLLTCTAREPLHVSETRKGGHRDEVAWLVRKGGESAPFRWNLGRMGTGSLHWYPKSPRFDVQPFSLFLSSQFNNKHLVLFLAKNRKFMKFSFDNFFWMIFAIKVNFVY